MPLGTLDRNPPPFFKQGPSALSKLMVFSALALFLMVADTRFALTQPLRAAVGTVLYPVQWVALRQLLAVRERLSSTGQAAEVLYDAPDPYTRKIIIDKGLVQGVQEGSPVLD